MCRFGFVSSPPWNSIYAILLHPSGKLLPNQPTRPSLRPLQELVKSHEIEQASHSVCVYVCSSQLSKQKVHTKNQI